MERSITTGEVLLICEKATAKQSKCYNTNDRSELGFEEKSLTSQSEPLGVRTPKIQKIPQVKKLEGKMVGAWGFEPQTH